MRNDQYLLLVRSTYPLADGHKYSLKGKISEKFRHFLDHDGNVTAHHHAMFIVFDGDQFAIVIVLENDFMYFTIHSQLRLMLSAALRRSLRTTVKIRGDVVPAIVLTVT